MLQVACCSSIPATLLRLTFWYLRYGFSLRSDIVWIVACWNYHVLRKLSISAERVIDHILYICQLCLSELHFTGIITLLFNLERGKKKNTSHWQVWPGTILLTASASLCQEKEYSVPHSQRKHEVLQDCSACQAPKECTTQQGRGKS